MWAWRKTEDIEEEKENKAREKGEMAFW